MVVLTPNTNAKMWKGVSPKANPFPHLAGATGIEPATSDVTGRRSNQLNYAPANAFKSIKLLFLNCSLSSIGQ
jgi:hypothetical protein